MRYTLAVPLIAVSASVIAGAQNKPRQELKEITPDKVDTAVYQRLTYRYIGPEGNRVTSVTGVAGDPNTYYAGAASGGLWKSTDGGIHWSPVFDSQPVSSVGALAVAPSDPNVVYAGTGEPFTRSHISAGWGMFRSTDAGRTWKRAGLENTGRISRIVVHPTNPDLVYAASLGFAYGPQPERGIYRSSDGGKNWERVLFVNDSTGASDIVMDPTNPRILYAGFWQIEIKTWGRNSGGRRERHLEVDGRRDNVEEAHGLRDAFQDRRQDRTRHQPRDAEQDLRGDRDRRRRADTGREADRQRPPIPLRRRRRHVAAREQRSPDGRAHALLQQNGRVAGQP